MRTADLWWILGTLIFSTIEPRVFFAGLTATTAIAIVASLIMGLPPWNFEYIEDWLNSIKATLSG